MISCRLCSIHRALAAACLVATASCLCGPLVPNSLLAKVSSIATAAFCCALSRAVLTSEWFIVSVRRSFKMRASSSAATLDSASFNPWLSPGEFTSTSLNASVSSDESVPRPFDAHPRAHHLRNLLQNRSSFNLPYPSSSFDQLTLFDDCLLASSDQLDSAPFNICLLASADELVPTSHNA